MKHPRRWPRVVGGIVLICLATTVIIMLWHNPTHEQVLVDFSIPEEPILSAKPDAAVVKDDAEAALVEQLQQDWQQYAPSAGGAEEDAPINKEPEPYLSGWAVLVGAFEDYAQAETAVQQLHEQQYSAFWREVSGNGEKQYLVYAGPTLDRSDAIDLLTELQDEAELAPIKGQVVPLPQ